MRREGTGSPCCEHSRPRSPAPVHLQPWPHFPSCVPLRTLRARSPKPLASLPRPQCEARGGTAHKLGVQLSQRRVRGSVGLLQPNVGTVGHAGSLRCRSQPKAADSSVIAAPRRGSANEDVSRALSRAIGLFTTSSQSRLNERASASPLLPSLRGTAWGDQLGAPSQPRRPLTHRKPL